DASGDEGWLARLEVQRPFTEARWTVFAFLDGGAVRKNKRPWRPEEDYSEARAGAGIGLSTPEQFPVSGRVEYAVPIQLTDEAGGVRIGGIVYTDAGDVEVSSAGGDIELGAAGLTAWRNGDA